MIELAELIINLFVSGLLILMGVAIKYLKLNDLIAGYNISSREEKEYMAKKGIGDFIGRQLVFMGLAWPSGYLLKVAGLVWGIEIGIGFMIIIVIYTLVKAQDFSPPPEFYEEHPHLKPAAGNSKVQKYILLASVAFTIFILAWVGWSASPSHFTFDNKSMKISGDYGLTINYSDIKSIKLDTHDLEIGFKTNGNDAGTIRKGHFMVKGRGKSLLFVRSYKTPPFIIIDLKNGSETIIINQKDPQETRQLFQQIKSRI